MNLDKEFFLGIMEIVDAGRLFPRLFMGMTAFLVWDVVQWYQALSDPNTQQASLVVTVTGIIPAVFTFYLNSGRKWKDGNSDSSN